MMRAFLGSLAKMSEQRSSTLERHVEGLGSFMSESKAARRAPSRKVGSWAVDWEIKGRAVAARAASELDKRRPARSVRMAVNHA
jgi:hypothetical protein